MVNVMMLQRRANEDDESEIRFLIHQSQAGAVIGRGGNKVKEMREVCCLDNESSLMMKMMN